ncbi:2067_t:CDS:2 [Cetraspora pellucida]|uniref:2067_t:CDS:1 n=2 Tax=Cetraspora pellucida TaxID=1433469 RepID=A0ACA9JWE3_9GLOM|nr:2060_t:CDS:2 [Cetraspora pellucida]CAG8439699.1 2067_t:CDS:2 [Cetraspora pellucida]
MDGQGAVAANPYSTLIKDLREGGDIEEGKKEKIYCITDPQEMANRRRVEEQTLESKRKIKENEMNQKNDDLFKHQNKIRAEEDKIRANDPKNILKAAAAKQKLIDIRFLQNDGDETKPLKDSKYQQIWNNIETNQDNVSVKEEAATSGIGLEVVRDAYANMNDTAVVTAIDAELAKDKPSQTGLTPADLKEKFEVDGVKLTKDKLGTIIGTNISDATKKSKLIDYIKRLPASDGIDKTSDETVLFSFFEKLESKKVIEAICKCELEDAAAKKALIKKMKEYKTSDGKKKLADDYFDSNGEPKSDKLIQFLYEEKLGKNHSTKDIETTPGGPDGDGKAG